MMYDPGLDDPIQDGADTVERKREEQAEESEEALAYLNPRWDKHGHDRRVTADLPTSRWWFASTAFPLLAVSPLHPRDCRGPEK